MPQKSYDYDDDVFTLEEDAAQQRRGHVLQYVLVALLALVVIGAALYGSYYLAQRNLEYQNTIVTQTEPTGDEQPEETDFWPVAQFPGVPELASTKYNTQVEGMRARVYVPMAAADGFDAYAERLADDGAQVYISMPNLTVLNYKGTEVHLVTGNTNMVELCAEPRIDWNELAYSQFPLPDKGVLVDQTDGTGEGSRVLTYRQASAADAFAYCTELQLTGWSLVGALEPEDYIFACTFRQDDKQISVDYFSGGNDYKVRLDFLTEAAA